MGDNITVAVHMNRLREKIEDDPSHPTLLQTVWGVGLSLIHIFAAKQPRQHRTDLRFSLAALALEDHHALPFGAGNEAIADILPVSYTHLDVYKRQHSGLACRQSSCR